MNVNNEINNDLNNKFKNGKIYKIVCNITEKFYVGSTTKPLEIRLSEHETKYDSYLKDEYHYITSFEIIKNKNYYIELICNVQCISKDILKTFKNNYIKVLRCNNKVVPCRSDIQYRKDNAEKIKQYKKIYRENNTEKIKQQGKKYRKDNAEKIKQYKKIYRENNTEKVKQQGKKYREEHADAIKQYKKKYREDNAEKIKKHREDSAATLKQKIYCECGGKYMYKNKSDHFRTLKHLNYLKIEL